MEISDDREDEEETLHGDESDHEDVDLMYSESSNSFVARRALEQFKGKNRQYGNAVCPECKQSFVNAARLERHLAVHQVFGAYLCPLCGKTYKYEYNLFFHWRKTCQYLNDLIKVEDRKDMDVQSLRLLVEEVVVKRNETEPDFGISTKPLFQGCSVSAELEMPIDPQSPLARACTICGILVHKNHLPQHEALHSSSTDTGLRLIDAQSPTGGYFCDLCGVAFRNKENLYIHWRSSCPEIMANIEPGSELYLSDMELKGMVLNLLWRLRRVSRQSPLRAIRTNRNCVEEQYPLLRSDNKKGEPYDMDEESAERVKRPSTSSADPEGKALVFMDDYVNPADTLIDLDGDLVNVISADRGKWNIPVDGKPLECPDCFRQFANAGRLERHISGFHSHYGAFKCLLCGHRFKYDYNLLFHYRHSCAYTKLLVGADVRKLLDAASLRKLVSHIKETDPLLRKAGSRMVNVKRRPSLKAVPRNVRVAESVAAKARTKKGLEEGKKCPVCGVMFYGQKSLDKHIGTVHLLNHNFLDKAITREGASPTLGNGSGAEGDSKPIRTALSGILKQGHDQRSVSRKETIEDPKPAEEAERPPILEAQGPGEVVPPMTKCVDVNGEEIPDFDAEQLSEMDLMLYTGQLTLGDLVITSSYGHDVEYRVAVGTRHGAQIVLERTAESSDLVQEDEDRRSEEVPLPPRRTGPYSQKARPKKKLPLDRSYLYQGEDGDEVEEGAVQYMEESDVRHYIGRGEEVEYRNDDYGEYEVGDVEKEREGQRFVRFVDETGQQLVQYLDENEQQCEGYVQFVGGENAQQIVELMDGGEIVEYLDVESIDDDDLALIKSDTRPPTRGQNVTGSQLTMVDRAGERYAAVPSSSSANNHMPEDFMQGNIFEE